MLSISMPDQGQGTSALFNARVAAFIDPEAYAFEAIKLAAARTVPQRQSGF